MRSSVLASACAALLMTAGPSLGAQGDCGQPLSSGQAPTATDSLYTLGAAVGLQACAIAVCDVDSSCTVTAVDALRVLQRAVGQPVTLDCDGCGENRAPVIEPFGIYRTYPGEQVAIPVAAADPDGDDLVYSAASLPDGCSIDSVSGVLAWAPSTDQLGPHYVQVTATDDGEPERSATALVTVQVMPPDVCVAPSCDPAEGCEATPLPIETACCAGEPTDRVAEPVVGCPAGLVLFAGRNEVGFGRMQNCDALRVISFAQGGLNVRFHVEARCLDISGNVRLEARLTTADKELVRNTRSVTLQPRQDGYGQALALFYGLRAGTLPRDVDGKEALLELTMTDAGGTVVERALRVILTLAELEDLPETDPDDVPASEAGCVGCHRPVVGGGGREGIEEAHPWVALSCTDCHGGDATATTRATAHVSEGDGPTFLRSLASDELDAVPPDYLRFVNPGDLRIADQTCGLVGCHPDHVRNVRLSTMSTYGGHYTLPRYLAGSQSRTPEVAAVDVVDDDFDPFDAPPGAIEAFDALREPHPAADRGDIATAIDVYLPKSCPTCHLNGFGRNLAAGTYRSSGCTACHMLYDDDGLSRSEDPVITESFPPHPIRHELTTAIPVEQCSHCHFQGGRIGLAYRGIREGGFAPAQTPEHGVTLGEPLYGHDADFYFSDEDSTNEVDETPPDLHFEAGMVCADCHVGGDVHGDGNLYSAERYQVGIRCEDCHGTVRSEITEDPSDGSFKNSKGFALRRLRRAPDDRILLELAMTGVELEVPQILRIIDSGTNPWMNIAMGIDANDFSHTESMECYTCHTSWRQNCFGCHVEVDDTRSARNETTGETSQGAIAAVRDYYSTDFFALGVDRNGLIAPLCSSMSIFMSYIDESGALRYEDMIRTSSDGKKGFGWNPFHHHTVSRIPQNCDRCHPVAAGAGPDNSATLLETYGFGNNSFLVDDGLGITHDLTRFLDDQGELISDFPHPGTGPVPADVRERALAVEVVPQPR